MPVTKRAGSDARYTTAPPPLTAETGASSLDGRPEIVESLTMRFLSRAMTPLVARGWVRSDPGPTGGHTTTVDVGSVSVLDGLEVVVPPDQA